MLFLPYSIGNWNETLFFLFTAITLPIITWPTSGLYGLLDGITVTNFDIVSTCPSSDDNISPFIS